MLATSAIPRLRRLPRFEFNPSANVSFLPIPETFHFEADVSTADARRVSVVLLSRLILNVKMQNKSVHRGCLPMTGNHFVVTRLVGVSTSETHDESEIAM